ncbi:MAG: LptE family protein [Ignavibacterium sp.]|nr:LptE family protein [Ignavibacterium sp.]
MKISGKTFRHKAGFTILALLLVGFSVLNFTGCCGYSFTGASVPPHLKTIAIPIAEDRSGSGEPGLRELFTEKITRFFIEDNSLEVAERTNADAIVECSIISLTSGPAVITGGETVSSLRITIGVKAVYRDLVQRKTIFDKNFSNYGDYSASGTFEDRRAAIESALDKIAEDILLETVSGW